MRLSFSIVAIAIAVCSRPPLEEPAYRVARISSTPGPVLVGRVTESGTSRPLADVQVRLAGTAIGTLSDSLGRYVIRDAPEADHTVIVFKVGYARQQHDMWLSPAYPDTLDAVLRRNRRSIP